MPKVTIKTKAQGADEPVRLNNGDLVIVRDIHAFLVSSYIPEHVHSYAKAPSQYCSLVELVTGHKAFAEPCSRYGTTIGRVAEHLKKRFDWELRPSEIKIIAKDDYDLVIELK